MILEEGGRQNRSLIEREAMAGSRQLRTTDRLLMSFVQFEDRAVMGAMEREAKHALNRHIFHEVPTSKALKERPELGLGRLLRTSEQWMTEQLGSVTATGTRSRGTIDRVLEESSQVQLQIFRRLIRLWLQATLMGSDEANPLQARSGKIGYAFDLVSALGAHFESLREFMADIIRRRNDLQIVQETTRSWKDAEVNMRDQADKRLFLSPHPHAHASQIEFLTAVQTVVDAYTIGFLHQAVLETISAMRGYCMGLRDELASWIEVLATGVPHRQIVSSLYDQIREDVLQMEFSYDAEQNISVQRLLQTDAPVPQDEDIARFLSAINWKVQEGQDAPLLSLELVQSGQSVPLLQRATSARSDDVIAMKSKLLECAQRSLVSTPDSVLDALVRAFPNPELLGAELSSCAQPVVELERSLFATPAKTGTIFCVAQTRQSKYEPIGKYVNAVESVLRAKTGAFGVDPDRWINVLNFSDPCKAILLNTLELLSVDGFRSWSESMRAYSDPNNPPPLMHHVFPAEVNAARYESRIIATRSGEYRLFHPRVVALLNDLQLVRQFIVAWASGWIRLESADALTKVEFANPTGPRQTLILAQVRNVLPDPFDIIADFGRAVEPLCAQYPDLAQMLNPNATEISAQLLQQLQMEREGSTDGQSLLRWMSKYREFVDARKGTAGRGEDPVAATHPEAYGDLIQLVELLLEEFLGARTRFSPLDFDTLRFFQAASWTVAERLSGYMVCSPPKAQSTIYSLPICMRTFFGSETVDGPAVQRLFDIARLEFKGEIQ